MLEVLQVGSGVCCCALRVLTSQRRVSLGQAEGTEGGPRCGASCAGLLGSSVAKSGVFTNFPLCWCTEGERVTCQVQCGVQGCAVCGADVTRTDMSAPSSWGPLGDGPLEVVSCSHANSKVREEYNLLKNLSERLLAEVVATRKEMLVQGLFVAFSGKYLDNSFMAMSNSASPLCSLSQMYAFWMGMSHFR